MLPADFAGMRVLDVGRFDGFYAFLAERRGAERVLAVDNEQYRLCLAPRRGIKLVCGEGFRANHPLAGLGGRVSKDGRVRARRSRRAFGCGILHRLQNPLGVLRVLRGRALRGGTVLIETYALSPEQQDGAAIRVSGPGEVYARDEFVYWAFGDAGLERLARIAGLLRGRAVPLRAGCLPPTDHRATARLTTPGRRPHDFFTS